MKLSKELMKAAHEMAKEIKNEYPEVDYKIQLGLCISYLLKEEKEEEITWKEVSKAADAAVIDLCMTNCYCNNWKKGEHDRIYIELRYYRKNTCKTTIKCGYWDKIKNEYVPYNKYTKQYDLLNKIYV